MNVFKTISPDRSVSGRGVALFAAGLLAATSSIAQPTTTDVSGAIDEYVGFGGEDPNLVVPTIPVEGAFGFSKTLVETPRSVSLISAETIDRMSITAVEDLARVVPGVFTTTRFGIQGGIDVRNVTADTYFRGMRRLSLQGNARSVLAALDSIEVVKGPPSPIFGMGKIGGYTNVSPKSGRARGGKYLEAPEGFFQAIVGSYDKRELSFGIGGPLTLAGRQGGYYLYSLFEDSNSFTDGVPIKQEILQGAMSIDNAIGHFRLETGMSYQKSVTAGALATRLTQDLVDNSTYIRGIPLVNLDLDGSGMISIRELYQASPVRGSISGSNMPLIQSFAWPRDPVTNELIPLGQFPVITGIPQTMYDYLVANPDKDPTGLIRAQGVGGPTPNSGQLPVGFVLDPTTVGYGEYIQNRSASYEKEVDAVLYTAYFDLINDQNPNFTIKNQLFFDMMNQHKFSNQPVTRINDVFLLEDKITVTRRFTGLPDWIDVNGLASINFRYTESRIKGFGGDYGSSRTDILAPTWMPELGGMTPDSSFVTPFENSDYSAGGTPFTNSSTTRYNETGLGLMFDINLAQKTNLLVGARGDVSTAKTNNHSGIYAFGGSGTSNANPMRLVTTGSSAKGTDRGISWSASLSHDLPFGLRPYATAAVSSVALDGASNEISTAIINGGHMGEGDIKEVGLKSSLMDGKLFLSIAGYEQRRTDVKADDDDPALIGAFASSTETQGVEMEIKWAPTASFFATAYFLKQESTFTPNRGTGQLVDARVLGFQDIVDPATGEVIYPAEAFLYGGRAQLVLPNNVEGYNKKAGNPETQIGVSSGYTFKNRLGITLSANYLSAVNSGRLGLVRLPSTIISNLGISYGLGNWDFKLDVFNLEDERYFKARTGDNTADYYIQAMPGRRWQANVRYRF